MTLPAKPTPRAYTKMFGSRILAKQWVYSRWTLQNSSTTKNTEANAVRGLLKAFIFLNVTDRKHLVCTYRGVKWEKYQILQIGKDKNMTFTK